LVTFVKRMATVKTTKVFVRNLSFKTTAIELQSAFETVGKVTNANIITRGSRSLGYGFVDFSSEEDANKAVTDMNKRKIDEREINVEIAKPRDESKPAAPMGSRGRGGPSYYRQRGGYGRGRYGGRGYGRGRGGGMGYRRRPRPPMRRERPSNEGRAQSTSTLFVANLPYGLDDTGLANIFNGLTVKTSHVIRRPNGRSKGFGFVEFESETDQQKGLAFEKKTVDGRELVIKVALTEEPKDVPTTTSTAPAPAPTPATPQTVSKTPVAAAAAAAAPASGSGSSPLAKQNKK